MALVVTESHCPWQVTVRCPDGSAVEHTGVRFLSVTWQRYLMSVAPVPFVIVQHHSVSVYNCGPQVTLQCDTTWAFVVLAAVVGAGEVYVVTSGSLEKENRPVRILRYIRSGAGATHGGVMSVEDACDPVADIEHVSTVSGIEATASHVVVAFTVRTAAFPTSMVGLIPAGGADPVYLALPGSFNLAMYRRLRHVVPIASNGDDTVVVFDAINNTGIAIQPAGGGTQVLVPGSFEADHVIVGRRNGPTFLFHACTGPSIQAVLPKYEGRWALRCSGPGVLFRQGALCSLCSILDCRAWPGIVESTAPCGACGTPKGVVCVPGETWGNPKGACADRCNPCLRIARSYECRICIAQREFNWIVCLSIARAATRAARWMPPELVGYVLKFY